MKLFAFALLAAVGLPMAPLHALSLQNTPAPGSPSPTPPGVTSWDTLGRASVTFGETDSDLAMTVIIPPDIEALDGTTVTLKGFMFPVDAELKTRRFLLIEYPADCPYCLAANSGFSRMVDVETKKTVMWNDGEIVVKGRLAIVHNDVDGLIYRLLNAQLAE